LLVVEPVAAKSLSRLADGETLIAALERLTLQGHPDQKPVVGIARDMAPEIVPNVSSLPPRETTADQRGQLENIRNGKRDKKSRDSRNFLTSNAPSSKTASYRRRDVEQLSSSDSN
jgi:hypothetical protein